MRSAHLMFSIGRSVSNRCRLPLHWLAVPLTLFCLSLSVVAQDVSSAAATGVSIEWQRVQALPKLSRIRIASDGSSPATCFMERVTDDLLTCTASRDRGPQYTYPRERVREIKLSNRGRSVGASAALGFGVGAGLGALVGLGINGSTDYHTTHGRASGAGAAVGGVGGALLGSLVGLRANHFAGPVIYRRGSLP